MEEFYDSYLNKDLPPVKLQYRDYAVWQGEFFSLMILRVKKSIG